LEIIASSKETLSLVLGIDLKMPVIEKDVHLTILLFEFSKA